MAHSASLRPAPARGFDRGFYRRGMVREIVDHQNAAEFSFHIHSPLHAAKSLQSLARTLGAMSLSLRDHHRRQRVQHVVATGSGQREFAKRCAVMSDAKANAFLCRSPRRWRPNRCPRKIRTSRPGKTPSRPRARNAGPDSLGVAPDHRAPAARHQIHQPREMPIGKSRSRGKCPRDRIPAK